MSYGIELLLLDKHTYDKSTGKFLTSKQQHGEYKVIESTSLPDMIWVRTSCTLAKLNDLDGKTRLFPSIKVITTSGDKRKTYNHFSAIQPDTLLLSSVLKNKNSIKEWGEYVIVKPRSGYGGHGIQKVRTDTISSYEYMSSSSTYIVQKMCDFSQGYEGIATTNHDVRIVLINGSISYCEIRINERNFKVNMSQGGTGYSLAVADIPTKLSKLVYDLWKGFGLENPGCVAFDFGFDANIGKWQLIEVNYSPGFLYEDLLHNKETVLRAFNAYAKYFVKVLKD